MSIPRDRRTVIDHTVRHNTLGHRHAAPLTALRRPAVRSRFAPYFSRMLTLEWRVRFYGEVNLAARARNPSPALRLSLFLSSPDGHDARSVAAFVRPRSIELSASSLPFVAPHSRSSPLSRRHTYATYTLSRASLPPSLPQPSVPHPFRQTGRAENSLCPSIPSRTGNTSRLARGRERECAILVVR